MKIRILAVLAAAFGLALGAAPVASANSFSDRNVGHGAHVSYNDGTDTLCLWVVSSTSNVASMTAKPDVAGRGPTRSFSVTPGHKQCRSLATAYEDSGYSYLGYVGPADPCRCGYRFGGDFYS